MKKSITIFTRHFIFIMLLGIFTIPNLKGANCDYPFRSSDVSITWNKAERRFEFYFAVQDNEGNDRYVQPFRVTLTGKGELFAINNRDDRTSGVFYDVWGYTHSGVIGLKYNSDGSFINLSNGVKRNTYFYHGGANKTFATIYWYPPQEYLDTDVSFTIFANIGQTLASSSDCINNVIRSVKAENAISPIEISKIEYTEQGKYAITYKRSSYNSTYDDFTTAELQYKNSSGKWEIKTNLNLPGQSKDVEETVNATEEDITTGRTFRICYYKAISGYIKMNYERYSNEVTVLPIKMPTNPKVEDLGCRKVRLSWDVSSVTQSSQAGYLHIYMYDGSNWVTVSQTAPYSDGKYDYTIPASYVGTGNRSFTFEFNRYVFKNGLSLKKEVIFTKQMNYQKISNPKISSKGSSGFEVLWSVDAGYVCKDDHIYKVVATQGNKVFTSSSINVDQNSATVTISSDYNFDYCSEIKIQLNLYDNNDKLLVSNVISNNFVLVNDEVESSIESLTISKGFYSNRVTLDWTASNENNFARYLIYRNEINNNGSPDILLDTKEHLAGVTKYKYEDLNANPGEYYIYRIEGQKDCGGGNILRTVASESGTGLKQPYGVVSGRVAYDGSTAVEGVTIIAEGTSTIKNKALDFSSQQETKITVPYKTGTLSAESFSFQAWVKPRKDETGAIAKQSFFTAYGKFLTMIHENGELAMEFYKKNGNENTKEYLKFNEDIKLSENEFSHITMTFEADIANNSVKAILYINGEAKDSVIQENIICADFSLVTDITKDSEDYMYIGCGQEGNNWMYNGYMDELRIWKRALSGEEIKNNYDCYISGKEDGLVLYYRFDELSNMDEVFDISGKDNKFNQNHGKVSGDVRRTSEDGQIPTSNQLSIKAITDSNGHYMINTIPYTIDGNIFTIIPTFGVHQFNPSSKPLFFSYDSNTHNNIDFTDVSSFSVSGTVYYEGGNYPVEGCSFTVDGKTVTKKDGTPIYSDENGEYTIDVPIGVHEVKVIKTGHTFINNGLALENGADINYQDNITGLNFKDNTRVKLIGRISGGKIENEKVVGFGESKNNIGATEFILKAKKDAYKLSCDEENEALEVENIFYHNNGEWTKEDSPLTQDSTIAILKGNDLTLKVSPETGEFVIYIHPEMYEIQPIKIQLEEGKSPVEIYKAYEILDLSQKAVDREEMLSLSIRKWVDSVPADLRPGELPHNVAVEYSDTIKYNAEWKYFYQAVPTFSVRQKNGEEKIEYLGDTATIITNPITAKTDTIPLISFDNSNFNYLFDMPVFSQGQTYTFDMQAYEKYINFNKDEDDPEKTDIVPVTTGKVKITNNLRVNSSGQEVIELDSLGLGTYEFCVGAPDLTNGIKSFEAILEIDGIGYNWDWEDKVINTYVLGSKSTGTDFMTAGPDAVEIILHDPPGSLSYSYIEKGTTVTKNTILSVTGGLETEAGIEADLGAKVITWAGFGAGTIIETETIAEANTNVKQETTFKYGNESETKTTFTEKFESSADPLYVGYMGDVFIGNSTNLLYGLTNSITVVEKTENLNPDDIIFGENRENGEYVIAKSQGLAFGQHFATRFAYTQIELEEIMIPKWKDNLERLFYKGNVNDLTDIQSPVYVSKLSVNDPNFGKRNTDRNAFGSNASKADKYYDGPSYKIYFPENYTGILGESEVAGAIFRLTMVDSVDWYNTNIELWEAQLAESERQKVHMQQIGNYSFGSGASIEASYANTSSTTHSVDFSFLLNAEVAAKAGFEALGVSMVVTAKQSVAVGTDDSYKEGTEESTTVGFKLQEEGDDDEITVDYGWTEGGTIAFKTRGGRTSCPYEGEVKTKYFEPGKHVLSEATMQIEVPVIDVKDGSYALRVPANRAASFTLQLKNESETYEDVWFQLIVDEKTNPYGAELKIDGSAIGNGRNFLVPAGNILEKTLTIAKGPNVDKYDNIALILRSQCQHDPTNFLQNIGDTTWVSVEFIPSCSDVEIKTPADKWIVNTLSGDTLDIILENYDVNYANFGYVNLQYRPTSTSTWKTLMKFYSNVDRYNNATGLKTLLNESDKEIKYRWAMASEADGTYELRAQTVCETSTGTFISEYITTAVSGIKDMVSPVVFGKAQPADGVLSGTNDIMIQFNEDINEGLITKNNFSIKGVKNGSQTSHTTAVHFDGLNSYMETEQEINLEDKSFTIEFWMKRNQLGASTILTHGSSADDFKISFSNDNRLQVKVGNSIVTSSYTFENTQEWTYWAIVYNNETSTINAYSAVGSTQKTEIDNASVEKYYKTSNIIIARNEDETNYGSFDMHGLKMWDKTTPYSELSMAMYDILTGNEISLIAYWPMDEGKGSIAQEKSRSRHGILNASWVNNPATKAASFNGNNSYMDINTGSTVVIKNNADFSIEFWFKGEGENGTLFSSGRGDGLTSESVDGKLSIFVENKVIKFANNSNIHIISTENYLDNQWHHFALSVNRTGTTNIYLDGNLTYYTSSKNIGSLSNAKMTIGARKWKDSEERADMYFRGIIDEFRIWKMALTENFISNYNNVRLTGDELGLIAYYPFDEYVTNDNDNKELVFSEKDQNLTDPAPNPNTNNVTESNETASIKDAGPIVDYSFDFVSNKDKIILNLKDDIGRIENTLITITAREIQDLNGNPMASAHTWNAYIDRSFLKWQEPTIVKNKKNNEGLVFDVIIVNTGGNIESFTVENIPGWLEVTPTSGQVQPLSTMSLKFTVHEGLNQGVYDEMLYLKSEYTNMMTLKLNVGTEKPDWNVDPSQFDASMSIIGQLKIDGRFSKDSEDLIAAFIENECVGVVSPKYNKDYDMWNVMLNVYGNTDNKVIEFRIWDASTGKTYANVLPVDMVFIANTLQGSILNPVIFETTSSILQNIDLVSGWNWVSFNVQSSFLNDMNILFNGTNFAQEIKSQDANVFSRYNPATNSWINASLGGAGLDNKKMYMIKATNTDKISVSGIALDPAETSIAIKQGWNWIAYIPQFNMTVTEAFSGFSPENGDIVKSISNFAVYDSDLGWVGSLEYMRTNAGYMYKSAKEVEFKYPAHTQLNNNKKSLSDNNLFKNAADYENNLSLIATVDIGKEIPESSQLVAKVNGEVRGIGELTYIKDQPVFFISIHADNDNELLNFSLSTPSGDIQLSEHITFNKDQIIGTLDEPKLFTIKNDIINVFPNPVHDYLFIEFNSEKDTNVTITLYDITDKQLSSSTYSVSTGMNQISLGSNVISGLTPGMYIIRVYMNNEVNAFKILKQ